MEYHSQIIDNMCSLYLTNYPELEGRSKIASVSSFLYAAKCPRGKSIRPIPPLHRPMTDRNIGCAVGCSAWVAQCMKNERTDGRTNHRSLEKFCSQKNTAGIPNGGGILWRLGFQSNMVPSLACC